MTASLQLTGDGRQSARAAAIMATLQINQAGVTSAENLRLRVSRGDRLAWRQYGGWSAVCRLEGIYRIRSPRPDFSSVTTINMGYLSGLIFPDSSSLHDDGVNVMRGEKLTWALMQSWCPVNGCPGR